MRPSAKTVSPSAFSTEATCFGIFGCHDDDHADAAVEGAQHFVGGDAAGLGKPGEDGRRLDGSEIDFGGQMLRQHARNVFRKAAAGDVGQRLQRAGLADRLQQRLHIDARRRHQHVGERAFAEGGGRVPGKARERNDLAHQRIAVRMHAGGGEAEDDVALCNVAGRQQLPALGSADGEACEIVVAAGIHARHFGRLAADQRAARLAATGRNAADDGRTLVRIELAGGEIVEEEQRLGALHDEIVDAHGNEVDADRVVLVGVDGDLQLGADAVIGGNEDRIGETGRLQVEQAAEAADLAVGARDAASSAHAA